MPPSNGGSNRTTGGAYLLELFGNLLRAQRAQADRGGGGSRDRTRGSSTRSSSIGASPTDSTLLSETPWATSPRWRPKERIVAWSPKSSADRSPPQGLDSRDSLSPQLHPPKRQALPLPQQQSGAASHNELEARTGPIPSHRQTRPARTDLNQLRWPTSVRISTWVVSPQANADNTR